jgi:hypothetical protein
LSKYFLIYKINFRDNFSDRLIVKVCNKMSSESGVEFNSDAAEALKLAAAAATDSGVQHEEEQPAEVTTNGENGGGDHTEEESAGDAYPEDAGENGAGNDDPLINEEEGQVNNRYCKLITF